MISDKLIRLRPNKEVIDTRFLEMALASPFSQEHILRRKTGLADAQVNISQPILLNTPILYPDLRIQRRIVERIEALQEQIVEVRQLQIETATQLEALEPAVLEATIVAQTTPSTDEGLATVRASKLALRG